MKLPKQYSNITAIIGLIQIIFIVIGIVNHDYFYLVVAFVLNTNIQRVIMYEGDESDI